MNLPHDDLPRPGSGLVGQEAGCAGSIPRCALPRRFNLEDEMEIKQLTAAYEANIASLEKTNRVLKERAERAGVELQQLRAAFSDYKNGHPCEVVRLQNEISELRRKLSNKVTKLHADDCWSFSPIVELKEGE